GSAEPEVGHHGENGAGTGAHAIDRSDDGLRAGPHCLHDLTGHPRELEKPLGSPLRQRPYDLVHIAARAEVASGAGDDQRPHRVRCSQCAEKVSQLCVRVERQRVLAVRTVERHYTDTLVQMPLEMLRRIRAWIEMRLCVHLISSAETLAHVPLRPARYSLSSPRRSISCFLCLGAIAPKRSTTHFSCSAAMRRN